MGRTIADPQLHLEDELRCLKADVTSAQRRLLLHIAECDRAGIWRATGHKSMSYWLSAKLGINTWMAERYVKASYALEGLPCISRALSDGVLSVEQVVELTRFATPEEESRLIAWAKDKAVRHIRRRGDNAAKHLLRETRETHASRGLEWWFHDDGSAFWIEGSLTPDQGAVVARALDRVAENLPEDSRTELEGYGSLRARRADALFQICSEELGADQDVDRSTVVIHADLTALAHDEGCCELQTGPSISPETARRLVCDGRLETVVYDGEVVVGIGRRSRAVPPKLVRALMKRDGCACAFPGCPYNRKLQAHHVRHWIWGGTTDLPNLVLVCPLHHTYLHEYHWRIVLEDDGTKTWAPGRSPPFGGWLEVA